MTRTMILAAVAAVHLLAPPTASQAGDFLNAAIREAASLSADYQFAHRCAEQGEISADALADFRDRVLMALEDKYTLDVDEIAVAEAYLVGEATQLAATVQPAARTHRVRSCEQATDLL